MTREPRKSPLFLALFGLSVAGSIPFAFVGAGPTWLLGIPLWLWSSFLFTAALSCVTAWGILRLWRDDELD